MKRIAEYSTVRSLKHVIMLMLIGMFMRQSFVGDDVDEDNYCYSTTKYAYCMSQTS